ncbi:glycosyltransferase-like KOBITO 1 isoform X2 [Gossypium hirsutum]|uniref:Glycosyltransferase-like KOBITO 1 isoform X2 n=1 Tax=Gossypium hirsutum TaxID=3635 RepID=A0ABM2ZGC1_GOSHI|nr:glycosyltransferase-like KOBITO 1 isoform X2 [Gossypium hirsutum]
MFYHKVIGVTTFYLFVEGHAASPNVSRVLESIPAFIIASTAKRKSYFIGINLKAVFFSFFPWMRCFIAPFCSIQMYGCADVKLQTSGFCRYREHVVWGDKDLRLKLLRKGILTRKYTPMNYDHLPKETHFGLYREATRGNPNYFLTYGNEKEAARVQDELCPNGAH